MSNIIFVKMVTIFVALILHTDAHRYIYKATTPLFLQGPSSVHQTQLLYFQWTAWGLHTFDTVRIKCITSWRILHTLPLSLPGDQSGCTATGPYHHEGGGMPGTSPDASNDGPTHWHALVFLPTWQHYESLSVWVVSVKMEWWKVEEIWIEKDG